jgi:hypothetical protein
MIPDIEMVNNVTLSFIIGKVTVFFDIEKNLGDFEGNLSKSPSAESISRVLLKKQRYIEGKYNDNIG